MPRVRLRNKLSLRNRPWENQIRNVKSIPNSMFKEVVVSSTVVYKNHYHDAHPNEENEAELINADG